MLICERQFDRPDRETPLYSLHEVDYYAWVPDPWKTKPHRLSLRKNLATGEFELYRLYYSQTLNGQTKEEVIFSGSFTDALDAGNQEYERFHGKRDQPDKPCPHTPSQHAIGCPEFRE